MTHDAAINPDDDLQDADGHSVVVGCSSTDDEHPNRASKEPLKTRSYHGKTRFHG